MASLTLPVAAEEPAHARLLTEGRSWLYASVSTFDGDTTGHYKVEVVGDTIAHDRTCKRLARYYVDRPEVKSYYAVSEEDGYLYFFYNNPMSPDLERVDSVPLVDFRVKEGDVLESYDFRHGGFDGNPDYLYVDSIDHTAVNGEQRRRISLKNLQNDEPIYWVEGVGASQLLSEVKCTLHSNEKDVFLACYENGKCVFTKEDFSRKKTEPAREFKTLLTDGKSWLLSEHQSSPGAMWWINIYFKVEVVGDTVVANNLLCKRLERYYVGREAERTSLTLYENKGRIFLVEPLPDRAPRLSLLMDFTMTTGDSKPMIDYQKHSDGLRFVKEDEVINVKGAEYRKLTVVATPDAVNEDGDIGYWVEGIGSMALRDCRWDKNEYFTVPTGSPYVSNILMESCYQDDKLLFELSDFTDEPFTVSYEPKMILSEGKSWRINGVRIGMGDEVKFVYSVGKDTIVDGKQCKVIDYYNIDKPEEKYQFTACEINGRVFLVDRFHEDDPAVFHPVLDVAVPLDGPSTLRTYSGGQLDGGEISYEAGWNRTFGQLQVRREVSIDNGTTYRPCWVEGIGASVMDHNGLSKFPLTDCINRIDYYYMVECYQDGECIFTQKDFTYPLSSIRSIEADTPSAADAIYDLQGRRLTKPVPGQLYIKAGRKHLAR